MKKLMIAAAIVCAAVFAQAATYNWNVTMVGVYDDSAASEEGALKSGLATYIFDANAVDVAVLSTQIAAGNLTGLGDALANIPGEAYGGFDVLGGPNNGGKTEIIGTESDDCAAFAVIFNNEDATKADKFWVSTTETGAIDDTVKGGGNALVELGEQTTAEGAGWQAITTAAPEPTSGLLLLLGVAGLALRRRRA